MKTNDAEDKQRSVGRRSLLRGGAVLAGAGLAGTALAQPASAAVTGDVVLGADNVETTSTGLTVNPTAGDPKVAALRLNNANGPSLYLEPLGPDFNSDLALGEIANTEFGPLIGVQDPVGSGVATSFLVTGFDLQSVPVPIAVPPQRLLDTRSAGGRESIVGTSPGAFDANYKLRRGSWLDVAVVPTGGGFELPSIFVNLTAVEAEGTGFLAIYPGEDNPGTSTLNVVRGQTVANAAFVAVRTLGDAYVVRVFTTATCWVIVDLTGAVLQGAPYGATAARAAGARPSLAKKMLSKLGRRS